MVTGVFTIPLPARPATSPASLAGSRAIALRAFVGGPENRLVNVAVKAVLKPADSPDIAERFNPLVLHGESGTGKSSLAETLAEQFRLANPAARVIHVTSADFARAYARAVDNDSIDEFRSRYRRAKLVAIEDLEHLAGKRPAQQELARTLDELADAGGRVLITCRFSPAECPKLVRRLAGRLSAGLVVRMVPPGPAARRAILGQLAELRGVNLADNVLEVLSQGLSLTVPQLAAALRDFETWGRDLELALDKEAARRFVSQRAAEGRPGLAEIAAATAKHFSLKVADLKGATRRQSVVQARSVAMYLGRELAGESLQRIGAHFGNRDHTTVLHACRKIARIIPTDAETRMTVVQIGKVLSERGTSQREIRSQESVR